ncbi:MAG: hypothetical protein DUD39_10740 [Coriobacteriaceae bacterium]|nr:MAG: hypothetical protein DUD39_10740 [Coriobacteriaceae bacterium]
MESDVSTWWVLIYLLIGAATIPLVRYLGPVAIRGYRLEIEYDNDVSRTNVIYRILSPALLSLCFVFLCEAVFCRFGAPIPTQRWMPTLFYWAILGLIKLLARINIVHPLAYIIEATCSALLAFFLEHFVVSGYYSLGIDILDQSNFAFQMEVAIFYVAVQMAITLAIRYRYRCTHDDYGKHEGLASTTSAEPHSSSGNCYGTAIDTSEKTLFEYERKFGSLLPKRYSQDLLLRTAFFAIMAIEDSNRPEAWRTLERIACLLGIAKTTGIMQQRSDSPLSDEESVLLAAGYIERMWDSYLKMYAKSAECCSGNHLSFSRGWYEYDYAPLADTLGRTFGSFYGDYCGTRLLNAGWVFRQVRQFEERNRCNLLPRTVIAAGTVFDVEIGWLSSFYGSWSGAYTVQSPSMPEMASLNHFELAKRNAMAEDVSRCCDGLKNQGCLIERVTFADGAIALVQFMCKERLPLECVESGFSYVN